MKSLADYLKENENSFRVKPPPHWKSDIVDQFIELGFDRQQYGRWVAMIKRSKFSWGDCMSLLKDTNNLPSKYNKIGFIINKLKPVKTQKLL